MEKINNRKIYPQLTDKLGYVYIEKAHIEKNNESICIKQGDSIIPIPIATISCIILGPGTTITHRAVSVIAESSCTLIWAGEGFRNYYATGLERDRSSKNILKQIEYYSDEEKHMSVVRKMYQLRFPDMKLDEFNLKQLRGLEGLRVKEAYEKYAEKYGIDWKGRVCSFDNSDDYVNKFITQGNQLLYHLCRSAIYTLGYSPAIGFIHTGKMDSFVYDIADLYKSDYIITNAFESVSQGDLDYASFRNKCNNLFHHNKLFKKIISDLNYLFGKNKNDSYGLWDKENGIVEGSINYDND